MYFAIKIDGNNEEKLRNNFFEFCKTVLILEDILKLLVKNPFYSFDKLKTDLNIILDSFYIFIQRLEKINQSKYPLSNSVETLFNKMNQNKFGLFKLYLEKKKFVFDVIFDFYGDNNKNAFYFNFFLLNKIFNMNKSLKILNQEIQKFNKFIREDIKLNLDREFRNHDYSEDKNIINFGNANPFILISFTLH